MTDYCEIVEDTANAESECPATDNIMVEVSSARGASTAMPVTEHPLIEETANAVSQVTIDAYAILTSSAMAQSDLSHTLVVTGLLSSTARGHSSIKAFFNDLATATAEAKSEIAHADAPALLISAAQATSMVTANASAVFYADAFAKAASSASLGLLEAVESAANAASMVVVLRRVNELVVETADGQSEAFPASMPQRYRC